MASYTTQLQIAKYIRDNSIIPMLQEEGPQKGVRSIFDNVSLTNEDRCTLISFIVGIYCDEDNTYSPLPEVEELVTIEQIKADPDLSGLSFKKLQLTDDVEGLNLQGSHVYDIHGYSGIGAATLSNSNLTKARITPFPRGIRLQIKDCIVDGATFRVSDTRFTDIDFTNLKRGEFRNCRFDNCVFPPDLQSLQLHGCNLTSTCTGLVITDLGKSWTLLSTPTQAAVIQKSYWAWGSIGKVKVITDTPTLFLPTVSSLTLQEIDDIIYPLLGQYWE
jgi:uncharacterized protein YjbI with pentapeptide repeats